MTAHIPEPIDNLALPSDRATHATPQAPSGLGHSVSVTSAAWIEWSGGECPVDQHTRVEVKCRGFGDETDCADAGCYTLHTDWWKHEADDRGSHDTDIIAYRVVQS